MNKLLSLAAVGLAVVGLTLAAPSESQAQVRVQIGGFGIGVGPNCNYGQSGFGFGGNYGYAPRYSNFGNSGYNYSPGFSQQYYNYRPRPTIVHPETLHWTPRRGLHTHGHMHVPHGNHYHTIPY